VKIVVPTSGFAWLTRIRQNWFMVFLELQFAHVAHAGRNPFEKVSQPSQPQFGASPSSLPWPRRPLSASTAGKAHVSRFMAVALW